MSDNTQPIELQLRAGELLRQLENMRADRPDEFENLPIYISMLEEGEIAAETAKWAANPDGTSESVVSAMGTAYRAQLHHAPSIGKWFIVIEGEDDNAMGDQPDDEDETGES